MPLDTTEFDKRIAASRFSGSSPVGTYEGQGEAVMQLALEIVKANFPDLVARTHSKVSGKTPDSPGASGEYAYSLIGGSEGIKLANVDSISPATRRFIPSEKGKKQGLKQREEINFDAEEVMRGVETVLHEMYHARSRAGFFNAGYGYSELTPEQKKQINHLATDPGKQRFVSGRTLNSMNPDYLNEEEFMANADALLSMKERLRIPEGSYTERRLRTLEMIMQEVPGVAEYIGARREPNIPTLKAPPTGTLGSIISTIDAILNDYSVKKTDGGAKPGTRRKDLPENKK